MVSFHKFPKELSLKETRLNLLGISKQPLKSHKVCSLHFPGGRKVLGALPTSIACFQIGKHPTVKLEGT